MSGPSPESRRWWPAVVALIPAVVTFHLFAANFRERNSVTIDETAYLTSAKAVFVRGDFDPLAKLGIAPLPVVLEYGPAIALHGDRVSDVSWEPTADDPAAVDVARITTAWVVATPLLALVVGWVYVRTGKAWLAGWAGLMVAASPTVIGFTAVAGTDACFALFFLLALIGVGWYADRPTLVRFSLAGLAVGLAVATKYSGVLVLPVAYLVGLVAYFRNAERPTAGGFFARALFWHPLRLLGMTAVAFVVVWAVAGFALSKQPVLPPPPPGSPPAGGIVSTLRTVHPPSPVEGFTRQAKASGGSGVKEVFVRLHGTHHPDGHRLYYLFSFLYKSTPAELLLTVAVVAAAVVAVRRRPFGVRPTGLAVAVGLGVLVAAVSLSSKQFGLRYLLAVYPVLAVTGATLFARVGGRWWWAAVPAVLFGGGQLASAACAAPWHISYVNGVTSGPHPPADLLGVSDVDWSQGWTELRRHLDTVGEPRVLHAGGRPNDVERYTGVVCLPWERYDTPPCRYVSLPASGLCMNPAVFPRVRHFLSLRPVITLADCVFLYDTQDPEVWEAYQRARLDPVVIPPDSAR